MVSIDFTGFIKEESKQINKIYNQVDSLSSEDTSAVSTLKSFPAEFGRQLLFPDVVHRFFRIPVSEVFRFL